MSNQGLSIFDHEPDNSADEPTQVIHRDSGEQGRTTAQKLAEKPAEATEKSAEKPAEKPAAVIVMLGANDRQQMRVGDAREAPRSPAWDKEYARRAESLARNTTASPISFSQSPPRPSGMRCIPNANPSGSYCFHCATPGDIAKGETRFTRIPSGPHSVAAILVSPRIASFAAA